MAERDLGLERGEFKATIAAVEEDSPAYCAGFEPGCAITAVNGKPVRDAIDWQWLSSDYSMDVSYIDLDGYEGVVTLEREEGEDWGFTFSEAIFDEVKLCRNSCTFCFMRQLPSGMRSSLSLRDDDFRLSFLTGTFVTLTNLSDKDVARIIEQHISPLRVSLHAVDSGIRERLIGRNAKAGMDNLIRLLDSGIEFDAQIVLVPDVNDGAALAETLNFAYSKEGIRTVGIVPLGFTRYQDRFKRSFDDAGEALAVIEAIRPFQECAMDERGYPWVYAADEFYRNAYGSQLLDELPNASFYGDFSMFEDGIGIIRSMVDDFREADSNGAFTQCSDALRKSGKRVVLACGEAMSPYYSQLIGESILAGLLEPLYVHNDYFGGNVNVTGLLCGCDIVRAFQKFDTLKGDILAIPSITFNADGLTLDGMTLEDIRRSLAIVDCSGVYVVDANPLDYAEQITGIAKET